MKYILNHKDKLPHSSLPCTKLGADDSLIGTKMVIITNKKKKSQSLLPAYPLPRLALTYRSETMRSFEAWKQRQGAERCKLQPCRGINETQLSWLSAAALQSTHPLKDTVKNPPAFISRNKRSRLPSTQEFFILKVQDGFGIIKVISPNHGNVHRATWAPGKGWAGFSVFPL